MAESLSLKWGTLKGWELETDKSREIMGRYLDLGASMSVMSQIDTAEQKKLICELIDAVDGEIWNDWSGEVLSKEEAKSYIGTYSRGKTPTA